MSDVPNEAAAQHIATISKELGLSAGSVASTAKLLAEGATVPFISLKGESIVADFLRILDDYVEARFGSADRTPQRHVAVGMHETDVSLPKNHP